MDRIASALGDATRWRLLELLAVRPRSVGELAELTGARQPQTTKHLQTLARAGLVTVHPLGQRRVYAVETAPLAALALGVRTLIKTADANEGEGDALTRYQAAIEAAEDRRDFSFERVLAAPRDVVWRHWADPDLLASWWAPPSMTVTDCLLEPRAGGRAVLEYRDAEGRYRAEGQVHAAEEPGHLAFTLSVLDAAGGVSFRGHHDLTLTAAAAGTRLRLGLRVTDKTVPAALAVAGIDTGWNRVLDQLADAVRTQEKDRTP
jgi:uncharacterized protein YndB with AHSA1/START domain